MQQNLKLNLGILSSDSCFKHQTYFQSLKNSKFAMCQGLSLLNWVIRVSLIIRMWRYPVLCGDTVEIKL